MLNLVLNPKNMKEFQQPTCLKGCYEIWVLGCLMIFCLMPSFLPFITIFHLLTCGTSINQDFMSFYGKKFRKQSLIMEYFSNFLCVYTNAFVSLFFPRFQHASKIYPRVNRTGPMGKIHTDCPRCKIFTSPSYHIFYR